MTMAMAWVLMLELLSFFFFLLYGDACLFNYPSAEPHSQWKNNPSSLRQGSYDFSDGSTLRPILCINIRSNDSNIPPFGFGFFTNGTKNAFYLVVFMLVRYPDNANSLPPYYPPLVTWSANRDRPVGENATLDFTAGGDLVLKDFDGSFAWSTNTSGYSITSLKITMEGDLILYNSTSVPIWESFNHPTDTWLRNQYIPFGKRLISRSSPSNLSSGMFYLSVGEEGIFAFLDSVPPKRYGPLPSLGSMNASIDLFQEKAVFLSTDFQYIMLEPNGHLNAYKVSKSGSINGFDIRLSEELLEDYQFGQCGYPTVCGNYGICSDGGQCSCPGGNVTYFTESHNLRPSMGCSQITPLSCENAGIHGFLELTNVTYFDFEPMDSYMDVESCKKNCLNDCSCKAALFRSYGSNAHLGQCSLLSQIYSLMTPITGRVNYSSYSFIKVQRSSDRIETSLLDGKAKEPRINQVLGVVGASVPIGIVLIILVIGFWYFCLRASRSDGVEEEEEYDEEQVMGALTKFSFLELKSATQDFRTRIGRGGFGSVYKGVMVDGARVAIKRLNSISQGKKEFLAEVNTIGSIHHFCLVRLIGYCAERSNWLLVYEYMCNGSLDKWIFIKENRAQTLTWEIRRKIIHGIATGLEYLHVHCNPNIIHFDIKPQNILLDGDFNVKISDFGLAKLINRDQSQVLTVIKGTPGYFAPELLKGRNISVKVDVFSFGIVILEIVCGRKNMDLAENEALVEIVKEKAENNQLDDLVNEDMQLYREDVVKMIKVAIWCLQAHDRRPSMSMVVKALEGFLDLDTVSDCGFLATNHLVAQLQPNLGLITIPLVVSILSGPR